MDGIKIRRFYIKGTNGLSLYTQHGDKHFVIISLGYHVLKQKIKYYGLKLKLALNQRDLYIKDMSCLTNGWY